MLDFDGANGPDLGGWRRRLIAGREPHRKQADSNQGLAAHTAIHAGRGPLNAICAETWIPYSSIARGQGRCPRMLLPPALRSHLNAALSMVGRAEARVAACNFCTDPCRGNMTQERRGGGVALAARPEPHARRCAWSAAAPHSHRRTSPRHRAPALLEGIKGGAVIADKAYDSNHLRQFIANAGMLAVIPSIPYRKSRSRTTPTSTKTATGSNADSTSSNTSGASQPGSTEGLPTS